MLFVMITRPSKRCFFFFFNDTATTEIYTLSLHDALPISLTCTASSIVSGTALAKSISGYEQLTDRKSTRLNFSHDQISYAVFCLKKKNRTPPDRAVAAGAGSYSRGRGTLDAAVHSDGPAQ